MKVYFLMTDPLTDPRIHGIYASEPLARSAAEAKQLPAGSVDVVPYDVQGGDDPVELLRGLLKAGCNMDDEDGLHSYCFHCHGEIVHRHPLPPMETHAEDCPYVAAKAFLDGLEPKGTDR
jgi:hypothetical protein